MTTCQVQREEIAFEGAAKRILLKGPARLVAQGWTHSGWIEYAYYRKA